MLTKTLVGGRQECTAADALQSSVGDQREIRYRV